jgi:hypothetical protein
MPEEITYIVKDHLGRYSIPKINQKDKYFIDIIYRTFINCLQYNVNQF